MVTHIHNFKYGEPCIGSSTTPQDLIRGLEPFIAVTLELEFHRLRTTLCSTGPWYICIDVLVHHWRYFGGIVSTVAVADEGLHWHPIVIELQDSGAGSRARIHAKW